MTRISHVLPVLFLGLVTLFGTSVAQLVDSTGSFNVDSCPPSGLTVNHATRQATWNSFVVKLKSEGAIQSQTQSHNSGDIFPEGQTIVSYTWTDAANNEAICYFPVVVNANIFTISGCPPRVTINQLSGLATWTDPVVASSTTVTTTGPSAASGSTFVPGTTKVSYSYQDLSGNLASCEFTVTVDPSDTMKLLIGRKLLQSSDATTTKALTTEAPTTMESNTTTNLLTSDLPTAATTVAETVIVTELVTTTGFAPTTDPCGSISCVNGVCFNGQCNCTTGYQGTLCDEDINECNSTNACGMNAYCNNTEGDFTCTCLDGYEGDPDPYLNCTDINECVASNPCGMNANCTNTVGSFSCICLDGYEGEPYSNCTDINECSNNPCVNGQCNNFVGFYNCTCNEGWRDKNCDQDIDECTEMSGICQNGGVCENFLNGTYQCTCAAGYEGINCETDINECGSYPCYNNVTCNDLVNDYECVCTDTGYEGKNCDQDINECLMDLSPCDANAECTNEIPFFSCSCNPGYSGDGTTCQICNQGTYGTQCEEICTCVEQSESLPATCNNVDGTCSCTPAFDGAECNKANLMVTISKMATLSNIIVEGNNLTLRCEVNLALNELSPPQITWMFPRENVTVTVDSGNGVYEQSLKDVTAREDKGTYYCVAEAMLQTGYKIVVSSEIFIDVIAAGEIADTSVESRTPLGETAVLNCTAYGNPPPDVSWTRLVDDTRLSDGDENGRIMIKVYNESSFLKTSSLSIGALTREDDGGYTCAALNNQGGDNETLTIFVLEPPLIEIVNVEDKSESTLTVSWRVTFDGNLPLTTCTVEYQQYDDVNRPVGNWTLSTDSADGESLMYDVTGLMPYTLYAVRLTCNNSVGVSNTEEADAERTGQSTPEMPRNVVAVSQSSSVAVITWDEPLVPNGPIAFYQISGEGFPTQRTDKKVERAEISGLTPGASYNFTVQAFNFDYGKELEGDPAKSNPLTMPPEPPTAPQNVRTEDTVELCTLHWVAPAEPNGVITEYRIYPTSQGRGEDPGVPVTEDAIPVPASARLYVISESELRRFSRYSFAMTASTEAGEGVRSTPLVSCETEPGDPQPPPAIPPVPEDTEDIVTTNSFKLNIPPPDKRNGDVSCYEIIVVPLKNLKEFDKNVDPQTEYPPGEILTYAESRARPGYPYVAKVMKGNEITNNEIVTIGDKTSSSCDDSEVSSARRKRAADEIQPQKRNAENGVVREETTYTAFTRSYVLVGDMVQYSSSPLADPVQTKAAPSSAVAIAVSIIMVLLVIVIIVLLLLIYRRRQAQKEDGLTRNGTSGMALQGIVNPADVVDIQVGPIGITQLEGEYLRKKANNNEIFQAEFKSIPESTGNVTKEASLSEMNKDKNRYINIIAFDATRVRLQEIEGEPGSDYINACYVDGYHHPAKFIASQGPRDDTVNDFWRMIWEQNSTTVVMLTRCFENAKEKCSQYWPDEGSMTYGGLNVTMEDLVTCSEYVIRKFSVTEVEDEEGIHSRSVTQFHFLGWPDFGVPKYPYSVLSFLKRVRQMTYAKSDKGNIVVHCSAGVGRTGTYILLDTMLEMIKNEKQVDIYNYIYKIRNQRNLLVQSIVQYIFIHRALVEEYKYGHTEVDLMNLTQYYLKLTKPDPETQKSGVDMEYRMVASQQVEIPQEMGNKEANKDKNRLRQVVPYDFNIVKLERLIGEEHSDYVNASYIDGYEHKRAYIATQGPLPNTVSDFWRMVWEQQSSTIVMLTQTEERGQEVCHQYWPKQGESSTQSYLAIQHVTEDDQGEYIIRDFQLTNTKGGGLRNIRQYHFQDWPEVGMPESGVSLIKLIGEAHKHQKAINKYPVIVHGSSGAGRTGVFCALSILLGRIQAEGVVDVFQTVRTLRHQRPHMVQDPTQYQFCYKAILNHLDSYGGGTYANYK